MRCNSPKIVLALILLSIMGLTKSLYAQVLEDDLLLFAQDVRLEEREEAGGFFLFVKKKPLISSVMLTESSERPSRDSTTYAYTTKKYNDINGNEKRVLNGRFIQQRSGFFIIDSTPEPDIEFGSAFVLFLPYEVEFGYSDTRNGKINIKQEGLYMSVRTFALPYANYEGLFVDNPFYLEKSEEIVEPNVASANEEPIVPTRSIPPSTGPPPEDLLGLLEPEQDPLIQPENVPSLATPEQNIAVEDVPAPPEVQTQSIPEPEPQPEVKRAEVATASSLADLLNEDDVGDDRYSQDTVEKFNEIADALGSQAVVVTDKNDIVDKIAKILSRVPSNESADVVILLDTTRSMWDDLAVIKSRLIPNIKRVMKGKVYRVGMVFYRDVDEGYVTKVLDFSDQPDIVQKNLNNIQASGGGDWPEAVFNALEVGTNDFTWIAQNKFMFIVGDAPPKDPPTGEVDVDRVYSNIKSKGIKVYPLIVPKK